MEPSCSKTAGDLSDFCWSFAAVATENASTSVRLRADHECSKGLKITVPVDGGMVRASRLGVGVKTGVRG